MRPYPQQVMRPVAANGPLTLAPSAGARL